MTASEAKPGMDITSHPWFAASAEPQPGSRSSSTGNAQHSVPHVLVVQLLARNTSGVVTVRAIDGKAGNVVICNVTVTIGTQIRHSFANNALKGDVEKLQFSPTGNPNKLYFGRQNFVEALHKVLLNILGNIATKREHRMGNDHSLLG